MKRWSLVALLLLLGFSVHSQDYFVLHVKGKVLDSRSGKTLKPNDILKSSDKIIFSAPDDALAIVSSKSGRFILKPGGYDKKHELVAIVKDALVPGSSKLSTRSGEVFKNVVDIKTFFAEPVLLLTSMSFKVDTLAFPLSEDQFFFIRYQHGESSKNLINKKLSWKDDAVSIVRDDLFRIDGTRINEEEVSNFVLYYMKNGATQMIAGIDLKAPSLSVLKNELYIIKRVNSPNYMHEIQSHFGEAYGKVDEEDVDAWVREIEGNPGN